MRAALACVLLAGCATVTPMQTASTLEDGHWRLGGQLTSAGYCGAFEGPVPTDCSEYPDGFPLPELRANARRGLRHQSDVGGSLQLAGQLWAPVRSLQVGLTFDGKHELWSAGSTDRAKQILSVGFLVAGAVSGRLSVPPYLQYEWGPSLFYGVQTSRFEWVTSVSVSQRTLVNTAGAASSVPMLVSERIGLTLGLFRRAPARWAVQLSYLTPPTHFDHGALQLQIGWFWDLVGT